MPQHWEIVLLGTGANKVIQQNTSQEPASGRFRCHFPHHRLTCLSSARVEELKFDRKGVVITSTQKSSTIVLPEDSLTRTNVLFLSLDFVFAWNVRAKSMLHEPARGLFSADVCWNTAI